MVKIAGQDEDLLGITAAMPEGTGWICCVLLSDRFIDVGIAEQHAVTLASGLAKGENL